MTKSKGQPGSSKDSSSTPTAATPKTAKPSATVTPQPKQKGPASKGEAIPKFDYSSTASSSDNNLNIPTLFTHLKDEASVNLGSKKSGGKAVVSKGRERNEEKTYDSSEFPTSEQQKDMANKRGQFHMNRLATMSDEELKNETTGLTDLIDKQIGWVKKAWNITDTQPKTKGERDQDIIDDWLNRAESIVKNPSANFRSKSQAESDGIKAKGWDEAIQTAVVKARVEGRQGAITKLESEGADQATLDHLNRINELMTISSSLMRFHTGGVAGSHDADSTAVSSHSTEEKFRSTAGGSSMGHLARTGIIQKAEADLFEKRSKIGTAPTMAEIQAERLEAAIASTTQIMTQPFTDNTNTQVISGAKNPSEKTSAMHQTRENTKIYLKGIQDYKKDKFDTAPIFGPPTPPRPHPKKGSSADSSPVGPSTPSTFTNKAKTQSQ